MEAQNSVVSAHCARMRDMPFSGSGYSVGSGCKCSSTSAMSALSQYMSAPICRNGVLR
jgi:hypothetical protein